MNRYCDGYLSVVGERGGRDYYAGIGSTNAGCRIEFKDGNWWLGEEEDIFRLDADVWCPTQGEAGSWFANLWDKSEEGRVVGKLYTGV